MGSIRLRMRSSPRGGGSALSGPGFPGDPSRSCVRGIHYAPEDNPELVMCIGQIEGVLLPPLGPRLRAPGWGRGCPFPSISLTRATSPRSHSHPSGGDDLARRIGPRDRLESRALLRGSLRCEIWISSGLRGGASGLRKSPGFGRLDLFGIPWILSSEMSLFNGLHATPGPFLIHAALSPQSGAQIPGCPSIRRSTALKPLARRKPLGAPRHGNRHRKGRTSIGMKLTPPSLFGKKLSNSAPH